MSPDVRTELQELLLARVRSADADNPTTAEDLRVFLARLLDEVTTSNASGATYWQALAASATDPTSIADYIAEQLLSYPGNDPNALATAAEVEALRQVLASLQQLVPASASADNQLVASDDPRFSDAGGGSTGLVEQSFPRHVVTAEGDQVITLPANATGIANVRRFDGEGSEDVPIFEDFYVFSLSPPQVLVKAAAVQVGHILTGNYTVAAPTGTGGGGTGGGTAAKELEFFTSPADFPATGSPTTLYVSSDGGAAYQWNAADAAYYALDLGISQPQVAALQAAQSPSSTNPFTTRTQAEAIAELRVPKAVGAIYRGNGQRTAYRTWAELLAAHADEDIVELLSMDYLPVLPLRNNCVYLTGGRPVNIAMITDNGVSVNARILGGSGRVFPTQRLLSLSGATTVVEAEMDFFPINNGYVTVRLAGGAQLRHTGQLLAWGAVKGMNVTALELSGTARYYGNVTKTELGGSSLLIAKDNSYAEIRLASQAANGFSPLLVLSESAECHIYGGLLIHVGAASQSTCLAIQTGASVLHIHNGQYEYQSAAPFRLYNTSRLYIGSDAVVLLPTLASGGNQFSQSGNTIWGEGGTVFLHQNSSVTGSIDARLTQTPLPYAAPNAVIVPGTQGRKYVLTADANGQPVLTLLS